MTITHISYRFYDKLGIIYASALVRLVEWHDGMVLEINGDRIEIKYGDGKYDEESQRYFKMQEEKLRDVLVEYPLVFKSLPKNVKKISGLKEHHLLGMIYHENSHKIRQLSKIST